MNTIRFTAAVAAITLALAAAPASAQEGNGNPFPFSVPNVSATTDAQFASAGGETYPNADVGSEAYVNAAGLPGSDLSVVADALLPGIGSEAPVQTANSLPRNFEVGTLAYARAESVRQHFAAQAERNRLAYAARAEASRN